MINMLPVGGKSIIMKIYLPISARLLTRGHIEAIEWLRDYKDQKHPFIHIGLLTDKALKGYKKPIMKFKDRLKILETVANGIRDKWGYHCVWVHPQNSLDPSENIKKLRPVAIASGDGWEHCELKAIKKFKLLKIDIKLPKKHSVTKIINICKKL